MELRYPFAIIIIIIAIVFFLFFTKKKDNKYKDGDKIANTKYIKNTDYYKKKIKSYNFLKKIYIGVLCIAIVSATVLVTRLATVKTENVSQYNRDIFLCMDVSNSVDKLNLEIIDNLVETVNKLHGERFGISIFNTSSVVLVPLTDDYDYVLKVLDEIKRAINAHEAILNGTMTYGDDDYFYIGNYLYNGTIENYETRGSSLIGDGLASCVYSFSGLDEARTRIIIFSTDNDLAGTPLVTLDKAASISKNKGVKVFGIGTKVMKEKDRLEFKNAVEKTGGKFYEHSKDRVTNIVSDIEATSKSLLKNQYETKETDIPQAPFIILMISVVTLVLLSKKVAK